MHSCTGEATPARITSDPARLLRIHAAACLFQTQRCSVHITCPTIQRSPPLSSKCFPGPPAGAHARHSHRRHRADSIGPESRTACKILHVQFSLVDHCAALYRCITLGALLLHKDARQARGDTLQDKERRFNILR